MRALHSTFDVYGADTDSHCASSTNTKFGKEELGIPESLTMRHPFLGLSPYI
jgi:hypothetical protein